VLAALLLRAGEVVPDARLVDEVWGESPPASAGHGLEAYVSRLRRSLAGHGVGIERRAGGYRLNLGSAVLDSQVFVELVESAGRSADAGDHARAAALAGDALGLWDGPILSGIPLHSNGRAEAERLEELRSRALEIRIDADLELGRHEEVVGELHALVEESPYRERFVAQLMVALYRSDRQAEALEIYERTRRTLQDDLGLRPSDQVRRLAGQIVRQEPQLRERPRSVAHGDERSTRHRRAPVLAVAGALIAVAVALVLALTIPTGAGVTEAHGSTRVALIRTWPPSGVGGAVEAGSRPFVEGLLKAQRRYQIETEIIDLFPRRPPAGGFEEGSQQDVARLSERLRVGNFDLVLWPLGLTGPNFYAVVPLNAQTRFVFLDYCCVKDPPLGGALNATGLRLRADRAAHLAGYLSGLMEARRPLPKSQRHMVSVIVGEPYFPPEQAWERGFASGARRALPGVDVRVDYSGEYDDQQVCELLANSQIDAGSGVVFAAAGDCGLGALSAAAIRRVWGVAASQERSYLGPHILASATKRFDRLVELSVSLYLEGRLPPGEDVDLGLADEAVGLVGINPDVPSDIRKKVEVEAARLRAQEPKQAPQPG
jgi:DNA-binding SARP family transcriptional activator/basic membrane lipoprotein Med (substrate-binding protein (PBP1-ABC) superfamily)